MAGIRKLQDIYKSRSEEFLIKLLNSFVIINKQNQGSFFAFHKEAGNVVYSKKGGPINYIDRILMRYYEDAISQVNQIPADVIAQIPDEHQFCFDYVPEGPVKMTLTHIVNMRTNKHVHTTEDLNKWAELFQVNGPNILFEGILSDQQRKAILDFVYADEEKIIRKYKTYSFTSFLADLFGMDMGEDDVDSIIFRFYHMGQENGAYLAKMVDPMFRQRIKDNEQIHDIGVNDYVYLIIIDLINFIEKYNIRDLKKFINPSASSDINYILLMNNIYKEFIRDFGDKYFNIKIEPPKFMQNSIFDINIELLEDNEVKAIIDIHPNYREIYKILLNYFRKKRKKANGVFDKAMLTYFNDLVDKLNKFVLNTDVIESQLPSFNEYIQPLSENFSIYNPLSDENSFKAYRKIKPVSVIVDEFQPLTNKHVDGITALYNKHKKKIILFAIYDEDNSLFSGELMQSIVSKAKNEFSKHVLDFRLIKRGSMEEIVNSLFPEYRLTHLSATAPRIRDYVLYLDFLKNKKTNLNVDKNFSMLPLDYDSGMAMQALADDDYNTFTDETPEFMHAFFTKLRSSMSSRQES